MRLQDPLDRSGPVERGARGQDMQRDERGEEPQGNRQGDGPLGDARAPGAENHRPEPVEKAVRDHQHHVMDGEDDEGHEPKEVETAGSLTPSKQPRVPREASFEGR